MHRRCIDSLCVVFECPMELPRLRAIQSVPRLNVSLQLPLFVFHAAFIRRHIERNKKSEWHTSIGKLKPRLRSGLLHWIGMCHSSTESSKEENEVRLARIRSVAASGLDYGQRTDASRLLFATFDSFVSFLFFFFFLFLRSRYYGAVSSNVIGTRWQPR